MPALGVLAATASLRVCGDSVISFPDPGLEAAIRAEIDKPVGDILDTDLNGLTTLHADDRGISNLEGIQYCTYLWQVFLQDNELTDISLLSGLSCIWQLWLSGNQIIDIGPLSGLSNLGRLYLQSNRIVDISPLSDLSSLEWLYLWDNPIVDIGPLSGLTDLSKLSLGESALASASPLSGLTNLTDLTLCNTLIVDISPLSGLTGLKRLYMWSNQIVDISSLAGMVGLTDLRLSFNEIIDVSPLSDLTSLSCLLLQENRVSDVQPLVDNSGLGAGDWVDVRMNYLDETPDSDDMQDVEALLARGVDLYYVPQREAPEEIIVDAWTSGQFTDDPAQWVTSATVPLHVTVSGSSGDPVQGAVVSVDGVPYGETDADGYVKVDYPILSPVEECYATIDVVAGAQSVREVFVLYESQKLNRQPLELNFWQALCYNNERYEEAWTPAPGEPDWLALVKYIFTQLVGYSARAGDVITVEEYKLTATDVPAVWLVRETVERAGEVIFLASAWTESEMLYADYLVGFHKLALLPSEAVHVEVASPAVLYLQAPDGSHAGYDPVTGDLVMDFPISISDVGEEPFHLFSLHPVRGEYLIHVIGTGNGEYDLSAQVLEDDAAGSETTVSDIIGDGEVHTYSLDMEPLTAFRVSHQGYVHTAGTFYGAGFRTGLADVAECVQVSDLTEPGSVLELDPDSAGTYRESQTACSQLVAGVVSTEPGITLAVASADPPRHALLALAGIVPVKVTNEGGPIHAGDLLVSSSTRGHAMRWAGRDPCPCALIGKALEPMASEQGMILVLLTAH